MNQKPATSGRRALLIAAGSTSVFVGAVALIGWVFHIPALTRFGPAFNPMAANTAIGFVLDGLALILIAGGRPRALRGRFVEPARRCSDGAWKMVCR